jgi:hypothetical protein
VLGALGGEEWDLAQFFFEDEGRPEFDVLFREFLRWVDLPVVPIAGNWVNGKKLPRFSGGGRRLFFFCCKKEFVRHNGRVLGLGLRGLVHVSQHQIVLEHFLGHNQIKHVVRQPVEFIP